MKILYALVIFFLIAVQAQAEVIIKMKSGKKITCNNYQEEGDKYCIYKSYGKICFDKKEVAAVEVVKDPFDRGNTDKQAIGESGTGQAAAEGLPPAAQSACYKALMDKRMYLEGYFPCEVADAAMESYYSIALNSYLCIYKPECGESPGSPVSNFKIKCSVTLVDGQWIPFSEKY